MVVIRLATADDLHGIAILVNLWHGTNVDEVGEIFTQILSVSKYRLHVIHVAEIEKQIVGFTHWTVLRNLAFGFKTGNLEAIFVKPEYRKQGIAKALMTAGIEEMKGQNVRELRIIDVVLTNWKALALYESFGFGHQFSLMLGKKV